MKLIDKIKNSKNACLLLQGGGMRGAYTTGVLQVFDEMGLREHFRHIVGESAGALNGAYFATGQGNFGDGFGIYYNHMCSKEFIDLKNFPEIINLEFLKDVVRNRQPLKMYDLVGGRIKLHVCVTREVDMKPVMFTSETSKVGDAILASMAVPIAGDSPVDIDGIKYIDGGVGHTLAYEYAQGLGCDLIVVVLTNPVGHRYSDNRIKTITLNSKFIASKYPKKLLSTISRLDETYNDKLKQIEHDSHRFRSVEAVFPSNASRLVSMLEIDRDKVMDCQRMGHQDARFFLDREEEKIGN